VILLAYIPTSKLWGFLFPVSAPTFVGGGVLDASYSTRSEVEYYCGFHLHFLWLGMVSVSSCAFGHLHFFLWKSSV
jgi:hypothetical protein